jgi:hypothetical protein
MAVEQIRPVEGQRKAAQRKTPELNVDTAITILFGTSRLEGDSFISTLRYARNEGMLEVWDSSGLVLIWKQLQHGSFRWPPIMDGVMTLSAVEFAALFDGLDWTRVQTVRGILKPTAAA